MQRQDDTTRQPSRTLTQVTRRSDLSNFNGRRRRRPRYRRRSPLVPFLIGVAVVALAGVAAWVMYNRFLTTPMATFRVLGLEAEPLPGAIIEGPEGQIIAEGDLAEATIEFAPPGQIRVTAEGYYPAVFDVQGIPETGPLYLQLEPRVLRGLVRAPDGTGVPGAYVTIGDRSVETGQSGTFEFLAATPGNVTVTRPAWEDTTVEWDGSGGRFEVELEPFLVRGLRVYSNIAADPYQFELLLDLAEGTAINALVMDTKEEGGAVMYDSQVPEAIEVGAVVNGYDVHARLAEAKARGLYVITRVVTFQDAFRAPNRPEHAITNSDTGEVWTNWKGLGWMDPTDPGAWEYPIELAVEACEIGFDEVQFDYVRFPSDGDVSVTSFDKEVDEEVRVESIAGFLAAARDALHPLGCAVSADIFGIVMSVGNDQGLGQRPQELSYSVDALSPMIYPSHYSNGWLNLDNPNDHPGIVLGQALEAGMPKLEGGALMRPWIQAFYYDQPLMEEQYDVADEHGIGYLLWNALSAYDPSWLPPESRYPTG